MKIERLQELLTGEQDKIKDIIEKEVPQRDTETYQKQYNVELHDVFDKSKRQDKPLKDSNGNIVDFEPVSRIGLALQKQIVQRAAAFLCANPIQLDAAPANELEERMQAAIIKVWDDNKLDYKSMDLAEKMMGETEVAELWFTEPLSDEERGTYWANEGISAQFKLRMRMLANSFGDKMRPLYDPSGNMIAFARGYVIVSEGKQEEHFDIYTDKFFYHGVKTGQGWLYAKPVPNIVGKIPVIYYSQDKPEWADAQSAIERIEEKLSNLADTNDYFGAPIFLLSGTPVDLPGKTDTGKALQLENGGDAKFVSWDSAPESTKLELEQLFRIVYSITDTPDLSFESLKGLGNAPSGYAMEIVFMGAHLKAARKAGVLGEGIQRRINYLKAALTKLDVSLEKGKALTIKPQFEFFLPKDVKELMETLTTGVMGGIVSKQTAVRKLAIADDVKGEMEQIEGEQNSTAAADEAFNNAA